MTQQLLSGSEMAPSTVDCRVYERKSCTVPTVCQPASALEMQEMQWEATICDISLSGARITLQRRFEKGTGLAIELSKNNPSGTYVVFVKVVHVRSQGDGSWALGCKFISELNEDELHNILTAPPQRKFTPKAVASPSDADLLDSLHE